MKTGFLENDHGLVQIVNYLTHCGHIIDKIFVSRPDLYKCSTFDSILKTKHKAVLLAHPDSTAIPLSRKKKLLQLYDLRAPHIDKLRYHLGTYPWHIMYHYTDIDHLYQQFLDIVFFSIVVECIPVKTVTLGHKDPEFITPLVKCLLRQRNRLRQKAYTEIADALANKINTIICQNKADSF